MYKGKYSVGWMWKKGSSDLDLRPRNAFLRKVYLSETLEKLGVGMRWKEESTW